MDPELLERITARRAELDEPEEQLAKQLAEVRAERNELAVAERVLERVSEQLADERASVTPAPGQVGGRAVMLIPHRTSGWSDSSIAAGCANYPTAGSPPACDQARQARSDGVRA
ncbi:hypothetical protein ACFVZR_38360 [Streptomyces sp. NPDC058316]|uniref:hypothetical protein n=1 Tax=unclassified Streptomyces TaxID=2593676 RepID=UPI003445BED9